MSDAPLLRLRDMHVVRGKRDVVVDVGLDVGAGERVALMGHNGSGKTSLLRALMGLLPVARGAAAYCGEPIELGSAALRRRVGVVFQEYSHDLKLTVRENLRLGARLFGVPRAQTSAAIDELASALELAALMDRRCEHLSGGQRRRVELARALLHRPQLLVLDEPTAGLDPGARRAFWGLLAARQREGVGILMSTHDGQEAAQATHVTLLASGRVLAADTPQALLARCPEDLILVESDDAHALVAPLRQLFGDASVTLGDRGAEVRVAAGHTHVPKVVEALAGHALRAVHLRRASLADVMLRLEREREHAVATDAAHQRAAS